MTATAQPFIDSDPGMRVDTSTEVNPYEAAPFLIEAWSEAVSAMSESEVVELTAEILRQRHLDWAGDINPKLVANLEESVYLATRGER